MAEDKWYQFMINNMADSISDQSVFWNSYVPGDAPETQAWIQVNELVSSYWSMEVTASSAEECQRLFLELRQKCATAGIEAYSGLKTEIYRNLLSKWNRD